MMFDEDASDRQEKPIDEDMRAVENGAASFFDGERMRTHSLQFSHACREYGTVQRRW